METLKIILRKQCFKRFWILFKKKRTKNVGLHKSRFHKILKVLLEVKKLKTKKNNFLKITAQPLSEVAPKMKKMRPDVFQKLRRRLFFCAICHMAPKCTLNMSWFGSQYENFCLKPEMQSGPRPNPNCPSHNGPCPNCPGFTLMAYTNQIYENKNKCKTIILL